MKKISLLLLLLPAFFACNNGANTDADSAGTDTTITAAGEPVAEMEKPAPASTDERLGSYVGMFEASKYDENKAPTWSNKINISIDRIEGNQLYGHSVVAGNDRPFEGTIQPIDLGYQVEAKEPGDDQYDGVFQFTIQSETNSIEGIWIANKKSLAVTERSYRLDKREFRYDPAAKLDEMEYTEIYATYNEESGESEFLTAAVNSKNPSVDVLSKEDVENMHKSDLEVMRNSIYARHGYSFKNRKMRYIFNYVDWYMPMHTDIRSQLTELELKNIDLIKRFEQHAARYYDSFGR